jgi:2-hydroxymuconate-semialdehyde hydrolase
MEVPERFGRVALMGAAGTPAPLTFELQRMLSFYEDPSPQAMARLITWFVYDEGALDGELDDIAGMRFRAAMRPEVRRSYEAMFSSAPQLSVPESALRKMQHPVLLVHGRDDAIIPVEGSYYPAQHLPNVRMHVYGRCGHWTQLEYPDIFHRLLLEFFGGEL